MSQLLPESVREDFPLLCRVEKNDRPLVYLDSAATALRPLEVIDSVVRVMSYNSANVHRSVYELGDRTTEMYEESRANIGGFIGAEPQEIVFTRNTTEGVNLVARAWKKPGRVLVSLAEHHSNLLPWQKASWIDLNHDGSPDEDRLLSELSHGDVAIVAISHISNITGFQPDIRRIADACHAHGAALFVDGAQSVPHFPVNVRELDCDFLAFSGHKLGGPTGIGVLFGKAECMEQLDFGLKGGSMVEEVYQSGIVPKPLPWRFEAGTPAVESTVGLASAVTYLQRIGMDRVSAHEKSLLNYAQKTLSSVPGLQLVGPASDRESGPLTYSVTGMPPEVLARTLSDTYGICVRSGFHCAQPFHDHLGLLPTLRVSFYVYNQPWEVDLLAEAMDNVLSFCQGIT